MNVWLYVLSIPGILLYRCELMTREIPRTEMAVSAVPKGILAVVDSWRRYAESTFWLLWIGRYQSYAGNLQVDIRIDLRANSMGLTLTKTQRDCLLYNKWIHWLIICDCSWNVNWNDYTYWELVTTNKQNNITSYPLTYPYSYSCSSSDSSCSWLRPSAPTTIKEKHNSYHLWIHWLLQLWHHSNHDYINSSLRLRITSHLSHHLIIYTLHRPIHLLPRKRGDLPILPIIVSICL